MMQLVCAVFLFKNRTW